MNDENGPDLHGTVLVDTLSPTGAGEMLARSPYIGPSPSVVSVERDNWQATRFVVPVSGVKHHPHYTDDKPRIAMETARARGEYPTQATALETGTSDSYGSLALEALAAPPRAIWDILRFPYRAVAVPGQRPWSVVESPMATDPYERGQRGAVLSSQWAGTQSRLKPTITGRAVRTEPGEAAPSHPTPATPDDPAPSPAPPARPGTPGSFDERAKPATPPAPPAPEPARATDPEPGNKPVY